MVASKAVDKTASDAIVEANKSVFDDDELAQIQNAADALALFGPDTANELEDISDYGSGFEILPRDRKDSLIGTPLFLVQWKFTDSKEYVGSEFVSVHLVTEDGRKWILNDGSTGICAQLRRVTARRLREGKSNPQSALRVKNGLRKSEYPTEDAKGNKITGTTYYLS